MKQKQRTLILCEYVPILSMHSDDPDQILTFLALPLILLMLQTKGFNATALKSCTDTIETLVTL